MAPDTHLPVAGRIRNRYLFASDLLLFSSATVLSFALRFEGFEWGPDQNHAALLFLLICEEIAYGPQSALWDQAENRLHTQKALLALTVR